MDASELLKQISKAVSKGRPDSLVGLVQQGLELKVEPLSMLDQAMIPALQEIGDQFGRGEAWLPELVMAGRAMRAGLEILEPLLVSEGATKKPAGTILLGTVSGDVHSIGKDIVGYLCRANGFRVIDLGMDIPSKLFVEKIEEVRPDILGLSALMTTTMLSQREVIQLVQKAGLREQVRILVGGAPVTKEWAQEICADGYASDAVTAVNLCRRLAGEKAPG